MNCPHPHFGSAVWCGAAPLEESMAGASMDPRAAPRHCDWPIRAAVVSCKLSAAVSPTSPAVPDARAAPKRSASA
eukprot:scaffold18649_cov112-Isochrysis_galbana.AAC.4